MKAILYIGHGTRSKKGADEARLFIESVMKKVNAPIQQLSFLELTEPCIEEGFERCVKEGATEIKVVPLFLLAAGHIKQDIPEALSPLKKKYPHIKITTADPFGVQERILDALAEHVRQEAQTINNNDSILLIGRGSSDPAVLESFESIKNGLSLRLGFKNVHVCYLAAASPSFNEGLDSICGEAKGRIIAIPYLLFAGLLLSEVKKEVSKKIKQRHSLVLTGSLGSQEVIQGIVIEKANGKENESAAFSH
ncbi:sirohydrochlorin chelatase [Cytobacillus sp. NCCP-133]|uniref:sirohydrochlorin chelatase n=1 Tax=Cytobacillus sp. NCCP-133 TaxID=766848 RepID=UPI00222F4395|nr:sirohydrochlorin chelatase [Cytobacillus sp. NCCP-133]GLB60043.1 cobalamin biosynthesis protein CbiX [Cytobacillus sp. NCCP-133]